MRRFFASVLTLTVLHDIIQAAMGWCDCHLWEFTIAKRRYGLPMEDDWRTVPPVAADKMRLRDVLKPRKTVIDYMYEFGDIGRAMERQAAP
jgi:hypothetical protein